MTSRERNNNHNADEVKVKNRLGLVIERADKGGPNHDSSVIERGTLVVKKEEMKKEKDAIYINDNDNVGNDNDNNDDNVDDNDNDITGNDKHFNTDKSNTSDDDSEVFLRGDRSITKRSVSSSSTTSTNDDKNGNSTVDRDNTSHSPLPVPLSSSSSSSCSCCSCRRLFTILLLVVVIPICLLFVIQIMNRLVLAFNCAFTTTATTSTCTDDGGGGGGPTPIVPVPRPIIPHYNEEEAKKYLFYAQVAFCTEYAITTWTCGYMCGNVSILSLEGGTTGTIDDLEQQQHEPTNMIRYIPVGAKYGVQGYVAQIPSTSSSTALSNDLSSDSNTSSSSSSSNKTRTTTTTTITTANNTKCIVSFRGSLTMKNWYADLLMMMKPWPTKAMIQNLTTTTTTTTTAMSSNTSTGTNNDNTTVHLNNSLMWSCPGCKAHHGFAAAYDELRYNVHTAIQELQCTSLVVTGHSLGAAIAMIASFDLRKISTVPSSSAAVSNNDPLTGTNSSSSNVEGSIGGGYYVESTWTFGLPRVGNGEFVNSFVAAAKSQNVSPPLWRIIHYHDPVHEYHPVVLEWEVVSIPHWSIHPWKCIIPTVHHPTISSVHPNKESVPTYKKIHPPCVW